jgi:hypothetical protein
MTASAKGEVVPLLNYTPRRKYVDVNNYLVASVCTFSVVLLINFIK